MKDLKNIIIMKCGTHANEKIEDIYKRKKQEEATAGYFLLGIWRNIVSSFKLSATIL